ncbi:MAG TPA: DUF4424 domain-containing protein [Xanthobacteraceae bacterium]|nr:DUF4424 domain-containing protein [Xanthobacteraceae bacterium]
MSEARANDTAAELATGGLIFVQNNDVEMRDEDLFISDSEIRVRYRFFNHAAKDVALLVAFPMPEIKISGEDDNLSIPTEEPVNILDFHTTVGGKDVNSEVEQRVFAAGVDRTQYLRDLGIPLAPHLPTTGQALDRLPREKWDELIKIGLAAIEEYDVGKGMEKHLAPRWALRTTFYWQQIFPANAETLINHRYKPSVGATAGTAIGSAYSSADDPYYKAYARKYCFDADFLASVVRARKAANTDSAPFTEERIEYILKTGANWSGPIQNFRLVVDKAAADNLISFCGEGVKKIAPTQFEMQKSNYTPDGNFTVLILKKITQ